MHRNTFTHLLAGIAASTVLAGGASGAMAQDAVPQNDLLNATAWMQNAVEYKATTMSLFQLAKLRLDEALADDSWTALPDMQGEDFASKPVAIISDLDETLIDNNVYEAYLVLDNTAYSSKTYAQYVENELAKAVPGAVEFLKYADSKGVKIFYVSNRNGDLEDATRSNLEKLGFPMGGNMDTVLLEGEKDEWTDAKESRLQFVANDYRVLLVMGDNLGDFNDVASGSMEERAAFLDANGSHFGHDWIMFPNPEYGSWESATFGGDWSKSPDQRRQEKLDSMEGWTPPSE